MFKPSIETGKAMVPAKLLLTTIRDPEAHQLMMRVHAVFGCIDINEVTDLATAVFLDRFRFLVEDWLHFFEHPEELEEAILGVSADISGGKREGS